MIELVPALVDRCIALLKRREEVKRLDYTDFIAPIMLDFEAVHKDYLDSFRRYRELLVKSKHQLNKSHPVIDAIQTDALFSEGLRSKILRIPHSDKEGPADSLVRAMSAYLRSAAASPLRTRTVTQSGPKNWLDNVLRLKFREGLLNLIEHPDHTPETKKARAIEILDGLVKRLQDDYRNVLDVHAKVKKQLLRRY